MGENFVCKGAGNFVVPVTHNNRNTCKRRRTHKYKMGRALGIDLGTTYTAVAVVDEHGKAVIVNNMEGQATTPSVVYVDHPHYIVGDVALQSTLTEPENVVQFIKRSMGLPDHRVMIGDKAFSPEFISSVILRKVVQEAADALRDTIDGVVITVPAYFSEAQRQATYEAGQLAGLNVLRIINEPTAAALSYGLAQAQALPQMTAPQGREITYRGQKIAAPNVGAASGPREITYRGRRMVVGQPNIAKVESKAAIPNEPRKILVYDLGGGTFDVTVLNIGGESLDVVAVGGESHLGGKDWDDTIMNWVEAEFEIQHGVALEPDASLEAELRLKAESAKRQLTARPSVPINFKARVRLPGKTADSIVPVRIELTREKFEFLTASLLSRTRLCLEIVMERGNLKWDDIAEILCVGGSSRMPMVRQMLADLSGKAPLLHDPDECVAKGAALQAAMLSQNGAVGAIQVNHVLPHTLGVATMRRNEAVVEAVVPALTPLPCANAREEFTTTMDNQTQVSVQVYEGEAADPSAYPTGPIGVFHLDTTPPRPKGVPKIRVEFRCDENGRIVAVARDQDTGKESRAFIHLGSSRSDDESRAEAEWLSQAVVS